MPPKASFTKTQASVLLDLLRGLAALLVLLMHWRNFLFVDYRQIDHHRRLFALPYLLTSAGHAAVMIFFVLSGYLISSSVFRLIRNGHWSWGAYFTHRLLRLWIVLLPGLLLCAVWDRIGLHLRRETGFYSGLGANQMVHDIRSHVTIKVFFQNLFFLQDFIAPAFGSDGALWSLSYEFWYYVLFPLGLFAIYRKSSLPTRIVCILLFIVAAWFVRGKVLNDFPIWLLGTLLALVPAPRLGAAVRWVAAIFFALTFFIVGNISIPGGDYTFAVCIFFFLWILLSATSESRLGPVARLSHRFSSFSYTLYVVHMPFVALVTVLIQGVARWEPDLIHFIYALGILLLTLVYAYTVAALTEFHTNTLRKRIERALGLRTPEKTLPVVSST